MTTVEQQQVLADENNEELLQKRRIKNEGLLTERCGYGKAKKRLLEAFYNVVWPGLVDQGWTQVEGTGAKVGGMYFIPKGGKLKSGKRGHDYYNRIRDVLDRVLQKRNEAETQIANAYLDQMAVLEEDDGFESLPVSATRRPRLPRQATRIDLSWKEGGSAFPRTSSRVGSEYQAVDLPPSDTFEKEQSQRMVENSDSKKDEEILHDQVWDPKLADAAGTIDHVNRNVKYNLKEAAMVGLHDLDYDKNKLAEFISGCEPEDGSNWTKEEKEKFRIEIFRHRKDLSAVGKSMNKSVISCIAYYLNVFKKSDDYRLLKTLRADERAETMVASEQGADACLVCGDGGSLLICDGCEGEFHAQCLRPPLAQVPEGRWECDDCVNQNFLKARDNLMRNTGIYERIVEAYPSRKRKAREMRTELSSLDKAKSAKLHSNDSRVGEPVFRPKPEVLDAVKKLALSIRQALA